MACISTEARSREDRRDVAQLGPVELDVLPRREVAVVAVVGARDMGQHAQLLATTACRRARRSAACRRGAAGRARSSAAAAGTGPRSARPRGGGAPGRKTASVRSRTNAASNSSYRYMTVLAEMLAVEARGGRARRRGCVSRRRSGWTTPSITVTVSISRLLMRPVALVAAIAASRAAASSLANSADLLQVLDPVAVAVEIDRRARDQFVAGQNFHQATLNFAIGERRGVGQSPAATASPTKMIAGPSAKAAAAVGQLAERAAMELAVAAAGIDHDADRRRAPARRRRMQRMAVEAAIDLPM